MLEQIEVSLNEMALVEKYELKISRAERIKLATRMIIIILWEYLSFTNGLSNAKYFSFRKSGIKPSSSKSLVK